MGRPGAETRVFLGSALRSVALAGLPLVGVAGLFAGIGGLLSAVIGLSTSLGNLWITARAVEVLLASGEGRARWTIAASMKLVVAGALLFVLFRQSWSSGVGFAIGYAALPLGLVMYQIVHHGRIGADPTEITKES